MIDFQNKKVNSFAKKMPIPVVCVSLYNNKLHWAGSPIAIKTLGKDSTLFEQALGDVVKETIINKGLSDASILKNQISGDSETSIKELLVIKPDRLTVARLRGIIVRAVRKEGIHMGKPFWQSENKPEWWPSDVPFDSPNAKDKDKGTLKLQLIEIVNAYRLYVGIGDETAEDKTKEPEKKDDTKDETNMENEPNFNEEPEDADDIKEPEEEDEMKDGTHMANEPNLNADLSHLRQMLHTRKTEMKRLLNGVRAMPKDCWLQLPKFSVGKEELQTLQSPCWISDSIINSYLGLLAFTKNLGDVGHIFVLPTHIASRWNTPHVSPWMATKVALSKFTWLFVPIHVPQHWILLVAHIPSQTACILDSLNRDNQQHLNNFSDYMNKRAVETGELGGQWGKLQMQSSQQTDGHSCGAFVMMNAFSISHNVYPNTLRQEHANTMRVYVLKELMTKGQRGLRRCDAEPCTADGEDQWIGCDVCGRWYHLNTCTTAPTEDSPAEWECDICTAQYK